MKDIDHEEVNFTMVNYSFDYSMDVSHSVYTILPEYGRGLWMTPLWS